MPTKHAILAELTANELRASIDFYELAVADRRIKQQLVDALANSRKARIDEILQDLSRERLKELCRMFDLDDSGRKKEDLVARLIRPAAALKNNTRAAPVPTHSVADMPEARTETLSVAQLEQYLWSAADILRGSIDSSDYKTYIFGLLFLKRLSDRFEEEAEKLIAKGFSETVAWRDPDEHEFFVPDRARWGTIQKRATNIGETLNKACVALEGVLAGIDYNDEHTLAPPWLSRKHRHYAAGLWSISPSFGTGRDLRRVWVRGHENVRKRVLIQAAGCNLGLLLRRLTGVGTPRSLQGRAFSDGF